MECKKIIHLIKVVGAYTVAWKLLGEASVAHACCQARTVQLLGTTPDSGPNWGNDRAELVYHGSTDPRLPPFCTPFPERQR
jgi:hypothetical protein